MLYVNCWYKLKVTIAYVNFLANHLSSTCSHAYDGEAVEYNEKRSSYSADLICSNNGDSLVIDCTVNVPSSEKLDKILNTSKYLQRHSGKRFIPIVFTNKDVPNSMREAIKNNVIIIDRKAIECLLKLIMSNNIEQAIDLFRSKIKSAYNLNSM